MSRHSNTIRVPASAIIAGGFFVAVTLACVFAPVVAPYGMSEQNFSESLAGISAKHLLGTDKMGRDILSRLLYGGQVTLLSALGVVAISAVIGIPLGLYAGYFRGWADAVIGRVCDVFIALPSLLLVFVFMAALGRGMSSAVIAMGVAYVPMLARMVRSLTLMEKNKGYVEAARSLGFSDARIVFRHILPNCIPTILVQFALDLGYAILGLAGLSFLGLGVQPPTADWGAMLNEGRSFLLNAPQLALAPGLVIVVVVLAINIFCDGAQQYLDPEEQALRPFKREAVRQHG
jgi:peptide/nickel transport system permease protein